MKKLLLILLVLIGLLAGVLFSSAGQKSVLLPLANFTLKQSVPEHRIVLSELKPGPTSLRLQGTVDGNIRFRAEGPVAWMSLLFDLAYRIHGNEVEVDGKRHPVKLALRGKLHGTPSRMQVSGGGEGFAARLDYRFAMENAQLKGIEIVAKGAKVDQLLALAGTSPYATGRLNLRVDMPRLDRKSPEGNARFTVVDGRIDTKVFRRDFGIDLPPVEGYRLEGTFHLEKGLVKGRTKLLSPLLNLELKEFRSDTGFRIYKSRYALEVPELSHLRKLTGLTLYGPWKMGGEFYYDRKSKTLQLRGESPSLDGRSIFFYDNGRLTLDFRKAGLPQLLALTGQPPLAASGSFSGRAEFHDLKKRPVGKYRLEASGVWDRAEMAKLAGTDPGEVLDFTFRSSGSLEKGVLQAKASYHNRLFGIDFTPMRYALDGGAFEGEYRLNVPDLARMSTLKRQGVHGPFSAKGTISYLPIKRLLKVEGTSGSLGGTIRFVYGGNRLSLTLKKVDGERMMRLLGQPPLLSRSRVNGKMMLSDLGKRIGSFTLSAEGSLDRAVWKKSWELDPGSGVKVRIKGKGSLRGERIDSEWNLESSLGNLALRPCRIQLDTGACTGKYRLEIPELERLRNLTGRIYHGPLKLAGKMRWDGKLHLDGLGKEWGGRIEYVLEGALLRVRTSGLRAKELMKMLGYTPLIEGAASSDLRFNLETEKGTLKAEMTRARFVRSTLTMVASRLLKYDLAKEVFDKVLFSSRIDGPMVIFNFNARSKRLLLSIQRGKIDRKKGSIDAVVAIDDRGKRYRLKLRGPLDRPSVTPLVTRDLVKKAEKELKKHKIDKKIEKAVPKELKEEGNPIGSFIKKLF